MSQNRIVPGTSGAADPNTTTSSPDQLSKRMEIQRLEESRA